MTVVYRPGLWQYVYTLLLPAIAVAIGVATLIYGLTTGAHDWGARVPVSLLCIAFGVIPGAYILGMSVEATRDHVSKIFLFGLIRETIPLDELATNVEADYSEGASLARFMRVDGRGAFNLYPSWVWRGRDVDALLKRRSRRWNPDADVKRQNGKLIAVLVVLGIAVIVVLGILFWGKGAR